jgi:hypothetical protein
MFSALIQCLKESDPPVGKITQHPCCQLPLPPREESADTTTSSTTSPTPLKVKEFAAPPHACVVGVCIPIAHAHSRTYLRACSQLVCMYLCACLVGILDMCTCKVGVLNKCACAVCVPNMCTCAVGVSITFAQAHSWCAQVVFQTCAHAQ